MLYNNINDAIGKTPLVRLNSYSSGGFSLYAKLEFMNPSGSVKDRAAYFMITDALARGDINKDTVIIEPTSGNTGIGLAMVCAGLKLKLILTMPSSMSIERARILKAYGAQVVLTDKEQGMTGAVDKAFELAKEYGNAYIPQQFSNPSNVTAHFKTTAPELFRDLPDIGWVVSAVGSGGTITGIKRYALANGYSTKVCAVEPAGSPMISQGYAGAHKIQGIGANFIPAILDVSALDRVEEVSDEQAFECARELCVAEGIFCGISGGAALQAAKNMKQAGLKGNVVIIVPDSGMKYLSTDLLPE